MSQTAVPIISACIFPNVGGWLGSICVQKNYKTWYESLKKPSWCPPSYVFPPVWTGLYCSMGYASYLVWRDGGGFNEDTTATLALYGTQLALNWAWTPIFFGAHQLYWSLVEVIALTATATVTAVGFYKVNSIAGALMVPYLAWLGLATALNYRIYVDNPAKGVIVTEVKDK